MTITEPLAVTARREIAGSWLAGFEAAVQAGDTRAAAGMFLADGYWRDILALTWDLRTFAGCDRIAEGLAAWQPARSPSGFWLEDTAPDMFQRRTQGWTIGAFFTFETDIARCRGHIRLLTDPQTGEWKAWTLLTEMEDLKGFEEQAGALRPVSSAPHGVLQHGVLLPGGNGAGPAAVSPAAPALTPAPARPAGDPDVLVIGAGQAGLTVAARLRQLDVSAVVIEREARVGDNWRHRYSSLVLHNQVWANHLPYLKFPASWPAYLSKDELADWLESYAAIMSLDVRTSTEITGACYDEAAGRWSVTLRRPGGAVTDLHPRDVVLATGVFGVPHRPEIPGAAQFTGRLLHATEYTGGIPAAGVRALVVGSGSSAHDVAQDLHDAGAQVTMLQRSSTCVVSLEPGSARAYSIAREDGAPTEDCDLVNNSFPLPLLAELHKDMTDRIAQMDDTLLRGLRAAGFQLDFGEDGSGFLMKYHRTGGRCGSPTGPRWTPTWSSWPPATRTCPSRCGPSSAAGWRPGSGRCGAWTRRARCAPCGGAPASPGSGSWAAACSSAVLTPSIWPCRSRAVRKAWSRRQPGARLRGRREHARAEAVQHHLGERPADLGCGCHAAGALAVPAVRPVDHPDDAVGDHPGRADRADRAVLEPGLDDPDDRVVVPLVDHRHLPGPGGPPVRDLAEVLLDVHEQVGVMGRVRRHQRGDQEAQLVHRGPRAVPDRLRLLGVGLGGVPDDLVEQLFLAADVVVERRPVGAQAFRHVGEAGPPEPLLAEDPGRRRDDLRAALSVGRASLGEGGSSSAADTALHSHVPFRCAVQRP